MFTNETIAELQATYYVDDAKAQYAVFEVVGDFMQLIGIATANYDGTIDLTDIDADGKPCGFDTIIGDRVSNRLAARLFDEDIHFTKVCRF